MTQMVSAERAAALRNKCLNLAKTCQSGSGSVSERTSQSRQLMSTYGTNAKCRARPEMSAVWGRPDIPGTSRNRRV